MHDSESSQAILFKENHLLPLSLNLSTISSQVRQNFLVEEIGSEIMILFNLKENKYRLLQLFKKIAIKEMYQLTFDSNIRSNGDISLIFVFLDESGDQIIYQVHSIQNRVCITPPEGAFFVQINLWVRARASVIINKQFKLTGEIKDSRSELSGFYSIDNQTYSYPVDGNANISFKFLAYCNLLSNTNPSALVNIKFLDDNKNLVLPPEEVAINKKIGAFKYIKFGTKDAPELNQIKLNINDNRIKFIEFSFVPWNDLWKERRHFLYIEQEPQLEIMNSDVSPLQSFIGRLSEDDKLMLIYTTAPYVDLPTGEIRPNRLTKEFIKLGYKVVFFAFRRVPDEYIQPVKYNGNLLQLFKDDLINCSDLVRSLKLKSKIFICSSFPDAWAYATIERLKLYNWKTIYEIRDDMEEFNRVGYSKWYYSQLESKVARLVDKIISVSPRLASKIKAMVTQHSNSFNSKVFVIQNAAPDVFIEKSKYLRSASYINPRNASKIVGYIGHLTPAWFDWAIIINAANKHKEITIEIIGTGKPENLILPKNIICLGPQNHDEFLKISERWKAGLIPFIKSSLTYAVDPNKIYEYLAAGLMVLTAKMGAVEECPATYVYNDAQEFEQMFNEMINAEYSQHTLDDICKYVEHASWSDRARKMIQIIEENNE